MTVERRAGKSSVRAAWDPPSRGSLALAPPPPVRRLSQSPRFQCPRDALARLSASRRRLLVQRGVPMLVALGAFALGIGILVGGLGESGTERTAREFVDAWEKGDFQAMHRLIEPGDRDRAPLAAFRAAYERAAATATTESIKAGRVREDGDRARIP